MASKNYTSYKRSKRNYKSSKRYYKPSQRNCRWHGSRGGCKNPQCKFSHSNPNSVPLCRYKNQCTWGEQCMFRHKHHPNDTSSVFEKPIKISIPLNSDLKPLTSSSSSTQSISQKQESRAAQIEFKLIYQIHFVFIYLSSYINSSYIHPICICYD